MPVSNTRTALYVRCYAEDSRYWDDGIGYVVAAETIEAIERYIEHLPWKEHPYQTFYVDKLFTNFIHDITLATEIDD